MSAAASLERAGDVAILRMTAAENRFNPTTLAAIEAALDEVEQSAAALVLTGEGKFFSIGLDLDWMAAAGAVAAQDLLQRMQAVIARLLCLPVASVAALNGHAFARGAMLALACDVRVMREDRGYFCLPEVDLGVAFTPALTALLKERLPIGTAHEAMVTGRRYGAGEALVAGIVHDAVPVEHVLDVAVERAAALADKPRATLAAIKRGLYADTIAALEAVPVLPANLAG
jgi:enoyl-CoA hydratase/carnithine racemase